MIQNKKSLLPLSLTALRFLLGPVALACALIGVARWIFLPIIVVATLTDIFDGVIARRMGVATPGLRRFDSITDVLYYLFLAAALCVLRKPELLRHWLAVALILASEFLAIAVSLLRFGKYPAAHTYLAKFYGLCLPAALIGLIVFQASGWMLVGLAVVSVIANAEITAMHLLSDSPPVDVASLIVIFKNRK